MVLTGYSGNTPIDRHPTNSYIKDAESVWKERLAKHALRAIEIDGNVNRDPDFLMNTSLTQIQYEYDKRLGKTTNATTCSSQIYVPPKEFTQPDVKKEDKKDKIGSRLTGKADYSLKKN